MSAGERQLKVSTTVNNPGLFFICLDTRNKEKWKWKENKKHTHWFEDPNVGVGKPMKKTQ